MIYRIRVYDLPIWPHDLPFWPCDLPILSNLYSSAEADFENNALEGLSL